MRKTNKIIVVALLAAILSLGVGYAAIQNITLNITGTATATPVESEEEINPGGRLHSDFNGSSCKIYVENFAEEPIYARIKLAEYMEIGQEAGINLDLAPEERKISLVTTGANYNDSSTWTTRYYDEGVENATDTYWTWTMGGQTVYMPTFNTDKNSLEPDINGTYEGTTADDSVHYDDYYPYYEGEELTVDGVTHIAKLTETAEIISMEEWNNLSEADKETAYWVYDTDGWVYYSKSILPGIATGVFLNSINMIKMPDDNCYYTIRIISEYTKAGNLEMTEANWSEQCQEFINNSVAVTHSVGGRG